MCPLDSSGFHPFAGILRREDHRSADLPTRYTAIPRFSFGFFFFNLGNFWSLPFFLFVKQQHTSYYGSLEENIDLYTLYA